MNRSRLVSIACAAGMAALFFPILAAWSATAKQPNIGLIRRDGVRLRSHPWSGSPIIATLVQQTQVESLSRGKAWSHVRIWDSMTGWVSTSDVVFRSPWPTTSNYHAPQVHSTITIQVPEPLSAAAHTLSATLLVDAHGVSRGSLPAGSTVRVTAWKQDGSGRDWYQIRGLWAPSDSIVLDQGSPGRTTVNNRPVSDPVTGKGMWMSLGPVGSATPHALITAARHLGLSHVYVESAISPQGFHGRSLVGALIDEAHRSHIAVIAWVYPYLSDIAADVSLTKQVAEYRTSSGGRFDGIAADLERNFQAPKVRTYSQLIRAVLGPSYLLVGVTYPPGDMSQYPFQDVVHTYNAVAPMDYWHQTETAFGLRYGHMRYGYDYSRKYAIETVGYLRRLAPDVPVLPIGQAFDDFGRLEMGPNAPSAAELRGFLDGSKAAGAAGVSFFEWMSASYEEWKVIRSYPF